MIDDDMEEDVKLKVRSKLEEDRTKLWLPPFPPSDPVLFPISEPLQDLALKYAKDLELDEDMVLTALEELQKHSIDRYKAIEHFKETGVATLRITIPTETNELKYVNAGINLDALGCELLDAVASQLEIDVVRIKLIHKGKVLMHNESLLSQNVKNGSQMLSIILEGTPESMRENSDLYLEMQNAKHDAELLSSNASGSNYMELEDQSGNPINIPIKERKALMVAIALHERGRTAIKAENYSLALVVLLEADRNFSDCHADILMLVDNYALLNLDIAWCYLCLQSITHIPDAEARLTACQNSFHRSYGPNLERLILLKGSSGNEKALFMRLHLLQAIVYYHQNKRTEAKDILQRAERELNFLKIDEVSLSMLVAVGFSRSEARMGLRDCEGDLQAATGLIEKRRQQKLESKQRARDNEDSKRLGHCDDGMQFISMPFVNMMVNMGYSKISAVLALKKSNNNVSNAVQIIQDQPELLNVTDLPLSMTLIENFQVDSSELKRLLEIGFDSNLATEALKQTYNNFNSAVDLLSNSGGIFTNVDDTKLQSTSGLAKCLTEFDKKRKNKRFEIKAAYERLSEGIETKEDDYLDLDLKQEEEFLEQYKKFLD